MRPDHPPSRDVAAAAGIAAEAVDDEPYAVLPRPMPGWLRRVVGACNLAEIGILAAVALLMAVSIVVGIIDRIAGLL